ncbi:MAG: EAL domain-containing protein [Sphingomonadales bacterium]|nr:EAL domain-containing protein [Sphingomonadales bacterium]NCO48605.1 EAL domain-containing protein [Sphingomonadales bacterium]NCO98713.1 EAL domain-containing protein [Sphingomonadales bacterium]NCP28287.1 EAL domain-containing protein [Sphingomonadales bacterium]NCP43651.1 EAL domain-containing protein [Sphingomonadales bacterium]
MAGPVADQHLRVMKNGYKLSVGRDVLTGVIVMLAILMFAGTGGTVVTDAINSLSGHSKAGDNVLVPAFLLNIALILFGWRRYKDLTKEVEERAAAEQRANSLAVTDPLTGLLNRRTIGERTAEMISIAQRKQKSITFMMLDLDNFKNINDVHGHSAGDAVLKQVADRISKIVPPHNLLARLGGDEFACAFIFDPEQPKMVERIADDIIEAIATPIVENGNQLVVTTSIGMSRYDAESEGVDALMRRADIAMYSSKKQGRNRHCWFDASMEQELQTRSLLEAGMRIGIPNGEFAPYFEQQIDLVTGKLTGFEMLARWESPTQGFISPEIFIPIAEETGMIGDLSINIMRQALNTAKDWDPTLTLAVNISPIQLLDPWLAQKIVKLLVESGFPANRLEIEITESALFENLSLAQSIVGSLKNQGIKIALDDFGTGYSSLAHLRALPFDRIKIDRSFVLSIRDNSESKAIVRAIHGLGDSLGMPITAEGIEDKETEDELRKIGCAKGQGWYYGHPLSIQETQAVLAERNLLCEEALDEGTALPSDPESAADEQDMLQKAG